jgi:WD40 repeat protein
MKKRKKKSEDEEDSLENEEEGKVDNNENGKNINDNQKIEKKNEIQKIIRDLGSGKCKEYEGGHKGHVHALLGINTEKYNDSIISGAEDNYIKIININNPREIINLSGHENTIESLALDNSNQFLFSGSLDYTIKKWDLNSGECIITMEFNNAFQTILLYIENQYLLSVGVNSKIKLWNENCLNIKSYKYNNGYIKSGAVISYEKDYNKVKFVFGDDKGNIFIKSFIIGEENVNKYHEYMNKQKDSIEKTIAKKSSNSFRKSIPKLSYKSDENYNFKETNYETENTEL